MIVTLPRGVIIDTNKEPGADFDEKIKEEFAQYTEGTADAYTYQDKLSFIDICVDRFHGQKDGEKAVKEYLGDRFKYDLECGDFPQEEDYYNLETMQDIYMKGKESQKLHSHDSGDRHEEEKIERIIIRLIKAVLDFERSEK